MWPAKKHVDSYFSESLLRECLVPSFRSKFKSEIRKAFGRKRRQRRLEFRAALLLAIF